MIAADLQSARHELGLSYTELAKALGMNRRTVTRMASGKWPIHKRTAVQINSLLLRHRLEASLVATVHARRAADKEG